MSKQKPILILITICIFTNLSYSSGYLSFNYKNQNINFEYEILASYSRLTEVLKNDLNANFSLIMGLIYQLKSSPKKYSFHLMKVPNYEYSLKGDWKITLKIDGKTITHQQNFMELTFPELMNQIIEPKIKMKIKKRNRFKGFTLQLGNFKKHKNAIQFKKKLQKKLTYFILEK